MLLKKCFDWASIKGGTIVLCILSVRRTEDFQQARQKFFIVYITYDTLIFAYNRISKIQSINSDRDGFMSQSCVRISKLIKLILRPNGINFSLFWDSAESTLAYTETKRNQLQLTLSISRIG